VTFWNNFINLQYQSKEEASSGGDQLASNTIDAYTKKEGGSF
jgi:hypothetical protein